MGNWNVDATTEPGVLRLTLEGTLTRDEIGAFVEAHNDAIDEYRGKDYKVWCDLSRMAPLSPDCAALLEKAKMYSSAHENFRGSAVLVSSATVGLQHRRTSIHGGVMDTELISDDVKALQTHLRTVYRVSK